MPARCRGVPWRVSISGDGEAESRNSTRSIRWHRYVPRVASEWDFDAEGCAWQAVDSSLCFVDLSGFTKLSERLARRGRIGAEELTDVLNRCFGRMLELAYARNGALLKFGGDALLLHFTGADHPVHAASAAVEMRAALRESSQIITSVGRVALRMSVGVHSGTVHLFKVGTSHGELIVTGPAATRVAEMETLADAGEVVLSPETAARLPSSAIGATKGAGVLLKWRRGAVPPVAPVARRRVPAATIAACIPVGLRKYLSDGASEPEHRVATVGFVKFQGVDRLMSEGGADAVGDALHDLVSIVQETVDAIGVTLLSSDIDKDGGKLILVTGVPLTGEDDEGRMLQALRRIVSSPTALAVRAGVNRGHVFAGEVGSPHRATFTVIGDTVNLAARLMATASPGELYATPEVLDRSRTLYVTTALEPFMVRGKSQPVVAYTVGDELGPRLRTSAELSFTGRAAEFNVLLSAAESALAGSGTVVTIVGATGVGKTRLIDELRAATSGMTALEFQAEQSGSTSPYRGFRDPLRTLLGIERSDQAAMAQALKAAVTDLAPRLLPWLPLIGDVTHIDVPPTPEVDSIELRFRPDRTADVVIDLLTARVSAPMLITFEDAQWIDSASTALIDRLLQRVGEHPWLVIVARRPGVGGVDPQDVPRIELTPLTDDDVRAIAIAATAAAPLRPHEIDAIVQRSGGSPLFLGEVLRMARTGWVGELPASLDAVVNAEIDALGVLARRLVRYASVLGRSFRVSVLEALVADEQIDLDDATTRQLGRFLEYEGRDRVRFRHAMHREVAYEGLTYRRRRQLHLKAGEITEQMAGDAPDTVADLLSMHYALAHQHRKAWHYARIAGDRARVRYANVEAASQYERAIDVARRLDELPTKELSEVWRTLGDVREQLAVFEDAIDAYRKAAALTGGDRLVVADLLWRRARVRMHLGSYRTALAEATSGRRLLDSDPDPQAGAVRARLMSLQALLRQAQQRAEPALRFATEAIDEATAAGDDAALARALLVHEWAHRMLGNTAAAGTGERALAIYERLGDLDGAGKASNNLGALAYFDGRWDDAMRWYRKALDAYHRCGNEASAAVAGTNLGELLVSRGAYDEAESTLRESIRVLRSTHALDDVMFAEIQLGRLLVERGDPAEAAEFLVAVRAEAAALGQVGYVFETVLHLATAQAALGEYELALATIADGVAAVGSVDAVYQPTLARARVEALAGLGLIADACAALEEGIDAAREQGLAYEEALLLQQAIRLALLDPPAIDAANEALESILRRLHLGADAVSV